MRSAHGFRKRPRRADGASRVATGTSRAERDGRFQQKEVARATSTRRAVAGTVQIRLKTDLTGADYVPCWALRRAARGRVPGAAALTVPGPLQARRATLVAFGPALGTRAVLVRLRTVAAAQLGTPPAPLGFRWLRKKAVDPKKSAVQHKTGSDPPAQSATVEGKRHSASPHREENP